MGGGFSRKRAAPNKVTEIKPNDFIGKTNSFQSTSHITSRFSKKTSSLNPEDIIADDLEEEKSQQSASSTSHNNSRDNNSPDNNSFNNNNNSENNQNSFNGSSSNSARNVNGAKNSPGKSRSRRESRQDGNEEPEYTPRSPRTARKDSDEKKILKTNSFQMTPVTLKDQMKKSSTRTRIEWQRGQLLGRGAFGSVFLGLNNTTGALMAVKQITLNSSVLKKSGPGYERLLALEREISLMSSMCHTHIVEYFGSQVQKPTKDVDGTLDIFLEFVPGGSIATLLKNFGSFDEGLVRHYTRQILLGLDYLHRHDIIHRDIKGGNILVDPSGSIKLADFGTSVSMTDLADKKNPSVEGTVSWMAPEVIKQEKQDCKADIWSLGCTVVEMISGCAPWASSEFTNPVALMFHIASTPDPPAIPECLSDAGKDFVQLCLTRDTSKRPTALELLNHHFVDRPDFNKPLAEQDFPQDGSMQSFQHLFESQRNSVSISAQRMKEQQKTMQKQESFAEHHSPPLHINLMPPKADTKHGGLLDIDASFDEDYADDSFLSVQPGRQDTHGGSFVSVRRFLTAQVHSMVQESHVSTANKEDDSSAFANSIQKSVSKYMSRVFRGKKNTLPPLKVADSRTSDVAWGI